MRCATRPTRPEPSAGSASTRARTTSEFASYAELELQGRADAAALAAHGHRPGDVVVLAFEPGLGFIRSLYAAFAAGLVAAPVPVAAMRHPEVARQRLEAIIADSGSRLVLTEGAALLPLGIVDGDSVAGARVVEVSTLAGAVDDWRPPAIGSDSLALLQYTSGSTGVPKGVMVSHGNLVANEAAITSAVGITAASRTMGWLPHYHDMGLVGQLLQPISVAADSVLTSPSQFLRRPLLWLRLISRAPLARTRWVPTSRTGSAPGSSPTSSWRRSTCPRSRWSSRGPSRCATPRSPRFSSRFAPAGFRAAAFVPAYGMAETTLLVTASVRDHAVAPISADAGSLEQGAPASCRRRPGGRPRVVWSARPPATRSRSSTPARAATAPAGEIGEILVRGPSVAQGYWNRPRETAEVFGATIAGDETGTAYLRTGDLGALVDGELVITGRLKDLIIIRGRNLYPQDLETTAGALLHSGCLSAAFEGTASQPQVGLVAEVDLARVPADELGGFAEQVRRSVADEYMIPELGVALIRKGTLPRTTSGKVQRGLTRSLLADDRLATVLTVGFESRAVA